MRIISGKFRGKQFSPPANIPARPTTDFAKEALFNILANYIEFENIKYLDLFGGTGNIAFEMFSRGCNDITIVDLSPISINFIKKMAATLKMDTAKIIKGDALHFIQHDYRTYDLIFAGPPYAMEEINDIPDMVLRDKLLHENGWFILETSPKHDFSDHPKLLRVNHYGQTHFWFFGHHVK